MSTLPPVYSDSIIPAICLLDYINTKNRFYVENDFYPIPKRPTKTVGKELKPFVDSIYSTADGRSIKLPDIYYRFDGDYYSKNYTILWSPDKRQRKSFFVRYYGKGEPNLTGKNKLFPLNYVFSSTFSSEDENPATEDESLAILSFHLTEVMTILLYAYIFDINLASDEFKGCTDNLTLYKLLEDAINDSLEKVGLERRFEINEEMVEKYNGPIYYTKDDDDENPKNYPAYWDIANENIEKIHTLQTFIKKLFNHSSFAKKGGKFQFNSYFNKEKAELLTLLKNKEHFNNKIGKQIYFNKSTEKDVARFQIILKTNLVNRDVVHPGEGIEFFATKFFNQSTRSIEPLTNQTEYMQKLNMKRVEGNVYIRFAPKFSTFGKGSYGLNCDLINIDVTVKQSSMQFVDYFQQQAMERNRDEEVATLLESPPEKEYNEISDE